MKPFIAGVAIWALVTVLCQSAGAQTRPQVKHASGGYVSVLGAQLWYESEGQGEPLILISGGPGDSHSIFHPFFSRLADRNRVIYYDAFGVGKSDRAKSRKEYKFARDIDDLETLRKALGLAKINLLGQSYGGMVAQAYALKYPDAVERLILASTFHSGKMWQANNDSCNYEIRSQYPEAWERLQTMRAQGLRSSAPEYQKEYYGVPLGLFYFHDASKADLLPQGDGNNEVYYAIAGDDADYTIGGDIAALDFRSGLHKLKMPVLVVAGRFDRVSVPRYALEFKRYAPQAQFVMLESSGHFPFIEEPDKTESVLRDFLAK